MQRTHTESYRSNTQCAQLVFCIAVLGLGATSLQWYCSCVVHFVFWCNPLCLVFCSSLCCVGLCWTLCFALGYWAHQLLIVLCCNAHWNILGFCIAMNCIVLHSVFWIGILGWVVGSGCRLISSSAPLCGKIPERSGHHLITARVTAPNLWPTWKGWNCWGFHGRTFAGNPWVQQWAATLSGETPGDLAVKIWYREVLRGKALESQQAQLRFGSRENLTYTGGDLLSRISYFPLFWQFGGNSNRFDFWRDLSVGKRGRRFSIVGFEWLACSRRELAC